MWYVPLLVLVLCLFGCNQDDLMRELSSPEGEAYLKTQVTRLKAGQFEAIEKDADPTIKTPELRSILEKMASFIPPEDPISVKLVGVQKNISPNETVINTTMEYAYKGKWLLINVVSQEKGGAKTITGFNVVPEAQSLEEQNKFVLRGKSPLHYLVFAGALFALAVTLIALLLCLRMKMNRPKWRWVLFILVGFGNLSINWTTGQWNFAPLSVLLFSAGAVGQLYAPWTVSMALPVGAMTFLLKRKSLEITEPES